MQRSSRKIMILLLLVFIFPATGNAKRMWDAEGVVTMRNGQPCFSYPQDKEIRSDKSYAFTSLGVSKRFPSDQPVVWEIQLKNDANKNLVEPNSPETCIAYNVLNPRIKERHSAKPLQLDMPYDMSMRVSSSGYRRIFHSDFCLSRDAKGKTVLVGAEWDDKANAMKCLKPGESPKRSLWQKLFGK